ncbi:MAG: glycoside hydrolase family 2 protein [bacterium]|nr:glycoside hydrolase family 2 protein [bacterium]
MKSTRKRGGLLFAVLGLLCLTPAAAQDTERLMLSGSGYGDTVDWELFVTDGRRSGEWTTIAVPSQWEQHGFGSYNYGHDDDQSRELGRYRHRFGVPAEWRGRTVDLVFEGVMTDTEARLNDETVGPPHRGGFYRFRYDVTRLLRFGEENLLEVTVRKHSADRSVNRAEREADYWIFGGIYRPVWLEARPAESIDHVAVDARHDGALVLSVRLRGLSGPARITARVESMDGGAVGQPLIADVTAGSSGASFGSTIDNPRRWSAESPTLYRLVVDLERDGLRLHRHTLRFGFRTFEVRADGLFVNGNRVLLKGVNRHAFWPASGRTLNRDIDRRDAELIKDLNMNAVRTSHYPPDPAFLDACDELGIYVIDELAGWHDAYGTDVGRQLVREMVERDAHHPSVVLWANGNEGGWNTDLDAEFAVHDFQKRPVFHPHDFFGGIDAEHYLTYSALERSLDPASLRNRWRSLFGELPVVMPTELLHGLYDGGSGAGLEDYWRLMRASPRAGGLFLWSFADEAIERTDRGGELDTDGNHAPDGVLGPYRELTGNYWAVREIFSPVRIAKRRFDGAIEIENRFDHTDLSECRFRWALIDLPPLGGAGSPRRTLEGFLDGPAVPPGGRVELRLPVEVDWRAADAVRWSAYDPAGRELWTWVLPTRDLRADVKTLETGTGRIEATESNGLLTLRAGTTGAELDPATGDLRALLHPGGRVSFDGGPTPTAGGRVTVADVRHGRQGDAYDVEVRYGKGLSSVRWTLFPSGWLRFEFNYPATGTRELKGVSLGLPRENVEGFRWLGGGPARVWRNRLAGARFGQWQKGAVSTPTTSPHEPKLEGFYADVLQALLATTDGDLTIVFESPSLYFGLFSPTFPDDAEDAVAEVPVGGISFLHGISAIGTKFHPAKDLGPSSQPAAASGLHRGAVWLRASPRR